MSRDFARQFYSSTVWKNCRENYKKKKCYLCERCGDIGTEVHHIIHLTPDNIDNPEVTLNEDNLMCLCHQCHMKEHKTNIEQNDRYYIDADGHVIAKKKE